MALYLGTSDTTLLSEEGCSMKKTAILVVLLFFFFSSDLIAETSDCQLSFALGRATSKSEHRSWGWFFVGMGYVVPVATLDVLAEDD